MCVLCVLLHCRVAARYIQWQVHTQAQGPPYSCLTSSASATVAALVATSSAAPACMHPSSTTMIWLASEDSTWGACVASDLRARDA